MLSMSHSIVSHQRFDISHFDVRLCHVLSKRFVPGALQQIKALLSVAAAEDYILFIEHVQKLSERYFSH